MFVAEKKHKMKDNKHEPAWIRELVNQSTKDILSKYLELGITPETVRGYPMYRHKENPNAMGVWISRGECLEKIKNLTAKMPETTKFGTCWDKLELPVVAKISALDSDYKTDKIGLSAMQLENLGIKRKESLDFVFGGRGHLLRNGMKAEDVLLFKDEELGNIGLQKMVEDRKALEGELDFFDYKIMIHTGTGVTEIVMAYNALGWKYLSNNKIAMGKELAERLKIKWEDEILITKVYK